ncbi:MAG: hypothetical protein B7Y43_01035 [Sphingomonas sp. 28-62-20]|uniref:Acg family FMN-binding oxidoreductase n=1 Tax=Sphingomonas sp. 28-62-20 TaxID=1970433 RepID=UPI000BC83DBC|nr:MAG: hypothetical protein B7Y43_01035 [Sphingomonas sp. 28-62-20]
MPLSRRSIILGAGGGIGLALVGAGAAWRVMRTPTTAIAPWRIDPRPGADPRLAALRYAILAPNPHNRQPWLIHLIDSDRVALTCDLAKRLPETDPFDRQVTIGFGTFMELARIAAAERGYALDVTPFPEGDPQPRLDARPIALLRFHRDASVRRDPLFAAIVRRHTNRNIYDPTPPTARQLALVGQDEAKTSADPDFLAGLRRLTVGAMTTETLNHRVFMESVDVMRIGAAEMDATPDGLPVGGPLIEAMHAIGLLDQASLADPSSMGFKAGLKMVQDQCGSVPAIVWIATPGNSRAEQLEVGRRYVRATLRAAALGLEICPMSQALQEYPEMADDFARIHALFGLSGAQRLQMLARIGTAAPVLPAPRWPLDHHLV